MPMLPNTGQLLLISNSTQHGSGYLDHVEDEIRDVAGKRSRVLFIPYALRDRRAYATTVAERWGPWDSPPPPSTTFPIWRAQLRRRK